MTALVDLLAYICAFYRSDKAIRVNRLEKLVFLIDWRAAIVNGQQISPIKWNIGTYGPWTDDISTCIDQSDLFVRTSSGQHSDFTTSHGKPDDWVGLRPKVDPPIDTISEADRQIIDHVIRVTHDIGWGDLVSLVYSTYPVLVQTGTSGINLSDLADRYNKYERPARGLVAVG